MSDWLVVLTVGIATVAMKAVGGLTGEGVAARVARLQPVLAPAFLAALVASQLWADEAEVAASRAVAVAAAGGLMLLRMPSVLVLVAAAVVAVAVRSVA